MAEFCKITQGEWNFVRNNLDFGTISCLKWSQIVARGSPEHMKSFTFKDSFTSPRISPISKSKPGGILTFDWEVTFSMLKFERHRQFFLDFNRLNYPQDLQASFGTSEDSFVSGFSRNNRQILSFRKNISFCFIKKTATEEAPSGPFEIFEAKSNFELALFCKVLN